mmetsp:Transcript_21122/g.39024  ORF Transcript_21122/g.39024 Transcript_21122/m.39024 type:complete len:213 (+) Transcript_21122:1-639(+)
MTVAYHQVVLGKFSETLEIYTEYAYITSQLRIGSLNVLVWILEAKYDDNESVLMSMKDLYPSARIKVQQSVADYSIQLAKLYDSKYDGVDFDLKYTLGDDFDSMIPLLKYGLQPALALNYLECTVYSESIPTSEELISLIADSSILVHQLGTLADKVFDGRDVAISKRMRESQTIVGMISFVIVILMILMKKLMDHVKFDMESTLQIVKKIS